MPRLSTLRFTQRSIAALPVQDKEYFVWDSDLRGFGVRVYPNGGKRYVARAKHAGQSRRCQIGQFGTIPFEEAKKLARKAISDLVDGDNPNAEKKSERLSPTVKELSGRFLEEYVPSHCKRRTQVEYKHALNKYIIPAIGSVKVLKLNRDDVAELHHAMKDTPYQANRTLGVLSKMMNQAEAWGLRPDRSNPCYHIKKYKEHKRDRFLSPEELICLRKALDDEEEMAPSAVAAFRLLIFTGARLSEIQTLKWAYIQGDRAFLPESKTGAKILYLNEAALDVLGSVQRIDGNPYVITGKEDGAYLTDLQKPWRRVRKQASVVYWRDCGDERTRDFIQKLRGGYGILPTWQECQRAAEDAGLALPTGLADVRIHDLRHTFASGGVMMGESLPMVGKLLGHTQAQTTARYAHLADDPVRSATQRIGAMLEDAMAGELA